VTVFDAQAHIEIMDELAVRRGVRRRDVCECRWCGPPGLWTYVERVGGGVSGCRR
jgi:hypothetical protein